MKALIQMKRKEKPSKKSKRKMGQTIFRKVSRKRKVNLIIWFKIRVQMYHQILTKVMRKLNL
jgi:hypothetical protein